MERVSTANFISERANRAPGLSVAEFCRKAIFLSLLGLVVFTTVPYGTVEPWWKAVFVCAVFALCVAAIIERLASGAERIRGTALLAPLLALVAFALLQTVPLIRHSGPDWTPISADAYGTQFFALQLLALALAAALLYRYVSTESRVRILIHAVIAVAAASAIYGMLRQTTQHEIGFLLPLVKPDQGYGQFINQNHFAFLMEMGLGLALGIIVGGGVKRELALLYFAALLPMWTALVLSNSRGGLLAMMVQLTVGGLLFTKVVPAWGSKTGPRAFRAIRSLPVRMLLLLVLLGGAVVGTVWMGGDRLVGRIEEAHKAADPAGVSRDEIWKATWRMFQAHPVAGVGMGGYWIAIHQHHDASGVLAPQEAHNDYLEVLSSGGVIGAALLIWFLIVLFRQARANLHSSNQFQRAACFGATLGLVGVGFHSLFDFGLHMMANALICIALVVIATNRLSDKNYKAGDV